ncbi:MAG: GDSL-type esterase/lipase family protein [Cellvibrio sp.]|jgi:hypothetical protein
MTSKLLTGSLFAALLLWLGYYLSQPQDPLIPASHHHIQYTGRIDFSTPGAPVFSWPGTMIQTGFTGRSLALVMDDHYGMNYFNVFLDQDWENPIVIKGEKGRKTYLIADNLTDGEHLLTLTKRTEGEEGATTFYGILLAEDGELTAPPPRPERRIEFFGDSITSGMGNEAPEDGPDDNKAEKNNFLAYGAITARNLNAEYVSTSQSGVGLMASFVNFTMQEFYDQLSAINNNDSVWDFSRWTPHVVVINLFQNDSALVEQRLNPVPTDEQRVAVYYDFIKRIRSHYPEAFIVCTLGTMDAAKPGSPWPDYIHAAVEQWKTETADERIDVMIFEFKDFYKHPRVHHHQENAEVLTAFIKEKMDW